MRICLISQEYPPETAWGGVGTQTWVKARALARLGHEVHVLACSAWEQEGVRTEVHDGVTVHRIQPPGHDFPVYGKPLWMLGWTWLVVQTLDELMDRHRFDVLDFPEFGGEGFGYQIDRTRWNWAAVVVQVHGPMAMFIETMQWPQPGSRLRELGTFMEGFSLRHADAIMASGSGVAEVVARTYGIPREKIDVVHCGVDVGMFSPAPAPGMLVERPTVLFVGKMVKNKGPLVMAEAVLALRKKFPDIHAIFIGDGLHVPNMIRERFTAEGALDNLDLLGFIDLDKLPDFYRRAHAFMAPAEYEGFGAVYIEAQACGCPVIASTSGGGSEAVADGETGFLIPYDDVAAATDRLERLLGDSELRGRMSEAGIRRVRETFAMDRYIGRVMAVYERAVAFSQGLDDDDKDHTDWESPHLPGKHRREDW